VHDNTAKFLDILRL